MRVLVVMIAAVVFTAGCREIALPPAGSYSEVLLVTENGKRGPWHERIRPFIEVEHDYVTSQELSFQATPIRAAELEEFPTVKNIVICGVLDSGTEVGLRIIQLIGQGGADRVARGEATLLKRENLPAPGQVTVIVTAMTEEGLEDVLAERGQEIEGILESSCQKRLRRVLLEHPNARLSRDLNRKYGFVLDVPYLYRLFSDDSDPPGIELIREAPTRSLGIFWADWETQPSLYHRDELFDLRAAYVWDRYDHDKMQRDRVRYTWTRFGGYPAVRMSGYWYNDDTVVGGYFETYFLWDESSDLLWAVDLLTFAPGRKKHPYVRELRAVAETFRYN